MKISDKNIIVSGISKGLGAELALRALRDGARVAGFSRAITKDMNGLLEEFGKDRVFVQAADMRNRDSLREFLARAEDFFGGQIDGLVNNAGVAYDHVLPLSQDVGLDSTIEVNLTNTILITREIVKAMYLKRSGSIVNIASILALRGYSGLSIYGASKAGLLGFTRSLAREMGRAGIRVNSVCPGYMDTAMTEGMSKEHKDMIIRRTPLGRLAEVGEVVEAVVFLLSESSRFITGQEIVVDGGITI